MVPPRGVESNGVAPTPLQQYQYSNSMEVPFPFDIRQKVVSHANPQGNITNSDMELADIIGHDDVLEISTDVMHLATCSLSDNTPDIAWITDGSTTTTGLDGYLIQVSSIHRRNCIYKPELHHIPGSINSTEEE